MAAATVRDIDAFTQDARHWLSNNAVLRPNTTTADDAWGAGSDSVAVFFNLTHAQEHDLIEAARAWQQKKFDAGFGAISWPTEFGGGGMPRSFERAYSAEESRYQTPNAGELFPTSLGLIATTIAAYGTDDQKAKFLRPMLRTEILGCQLFSEPGAGSDLASLGMRAERDGDEWVLNGQKIWTSGAMFADIGEAICRTDPNAPKHKGMTAFLVPFKSPGVEIRPIKQMSGGSNFNEVFFTDVRVPDSLRLGPVGEGWRVALTTLGFERDHSGGGTAVGGSFRHLLNLARWLERTTDPTVRQQLAQAYIKARVAHYTNRRAAAGMKAGQTPGPEASLGKIMWTQGMQHTTEVVSLLLGPRLIADTGEWGTWAWREHVLGAPGYKIAGGSDEIQRNIIGERVLGLPKEPELPRDTPFRLLPK